MTLNRRSLAVVAGLAALIGGASLAEAQTYRSTRPIRGAWLRPPSALTGTGSLDETLQSLAAAGVTDLFLEPFYCLVQECLDRLTCGLLFTLEFLT